MMVGMRLQKIMGITVVLALLTAVAAGLSVLNARTSGNSATWVMISRFVEAFLLVGFGLPVARESELQGSLFVGFEDWTFTFRDIINYGVLPGLVLGLILGLILVRAIGSGAALTTDEFQPTSRS